MPDAQCPICSHILETAPKNSGKFDALIYDCPQCGEYELFEFAHRNPEFHDSKQLISAWIRLQNKRGKYRPSISDSFFEEDWFKNLPNMGFPQSVTEKLDELLIAYADIAKDDYGKIIKVELHPTLIADIAAKNLDEIISLNDLLSQLEYIGTEATHINMHICMKIKGWQRIAELNKSISTSDSAFIAMWFDPQTSNYRDAVKEAVTACGYKTVIVDDTEFNDFIMDEVITLIRQARFLIADMTCTPEHDISENSKVTGGVRGGVYWEAGMARGMGKAVIQTCKKDDCSSRRIHFDLKQYKTIFWEEDKLTTGHIELYNHVDNPSFAQKLASHIIVTVGKGSYTPPSE